MREPHAAISSAQRIIQATAVVATNTVSLVSKVSAPLVTIMSLNAAAAGHSPVDSQRLAVGDDPAMSSAGCATGYTMCATQHACKTFGRCFILHATTTEHRVRDFPFVHVMGQVSILF